MLISKTLFVASYESLEWNPDTFTTGRTGGMGMKFSFRDPPGMRSTFARQEPVAEVL